MGERRKCKVRVFVVVSLRETDQLFKKKKKDTMDQWDEEKLRKVVLSKHGNPRTTTDVRP